MELMEAIKGRRSIRVYKADAVPEEKLKAVLEALRWAPSWANTQCCEAIVVRDPKLKSELAGTLPRGNPALSALVEAPLVIVLCALRGVSGYHRGEVTTDKGDWFMFDTGLAMENLCLAAHSLGLGTVIVGLFDHRKAAQLLGVPQKIEVVAMTPLGVPAGTGRTTKRKELSEFLFFDGYRK
jgi:nitroreductase